MKSRKSKSNNKIIALILLLAIVLLFFFFKNHTTKPIPPTVTPPAPVAEAPVSINTTPITETNFTGTRITIKGDSKVVPLANKYVEATIADFKATADKDVPGMRQEFGSDSPMSKYSIDFVGKYVKSDTTESVIISDYVYTGGANGISIYKVFTISSKSGKLLSLSSIIKPSEQNAFTAYVKKALDEWQPEGSDAPVVFPEDVATLNFSSFTDWSLDDKNLTLYFGQDSIAPNVVGSIAFPLPRNSIKNFLIND